jgi:hypothetical protein
MSATIKSAYGANNQAIVCTFTSLANAGQKQSTAIDNTSDLFLDALVQVKVKTNAGGTSATGMVVIYAYGTADGGTDYGDGVVGTDGPVTLTVPPNLRVLGVINAVVDATTYVSNPMSVAACFGGKLPDHWGIVVENTSGAALDASVGSAWYQGVQASIV